MSSQLNCCHPHCDTRLVKRGTIVCGRHWYQLTKEQRFRALRAKTTEEVGALKIEFAQYFQTRMIGSHEIVRCREETCKADLVWLKTDYGSVRSVYAATVSATDTLYDSRKHRMHMRECPAMEKHG
ncbi:MAG TPA: hypothetical protein PKH39_16295 [Woeseiaceae bacterium]|nr:hypothetical protein [Woeseiaceae bacterium]